MSQIVSFSLEEELKKYPELKESDIKSLREWCQKEPHLPKISDSSLAVFLHSNHYHVEPTKISIDHFYTIRTHIPEFFFGRDPLDTKHLGNVSIVPLEKLTKEGYHIIFMKMLDADASKFVAAEFAKFLFMNLDLWLYRSGSNDGHLLVLDVEEISLGHAAHFNPVTLKKIYIYLQEGLPVKLKGLHYFNVTPGMEAILKMMKPFLKKELLEILYLHHSVKTLEKFMPIEALPNEVGGKAGSLMELHSAQIKQLDAHRNWFLEEELRSQVDESKRSETSKSILDFSGIEGSFKKIDID